MCQVWCSSIQGISVRLGGQLAMGIYALFNIYRSAKFCVVVFMASLLQWGGQSVIHPCYTVTPPLPIDHRSMLHCYTFPCQLTIDPCYTITPQNSAQGICIMLYVKPLWCSGLSWIYSWLKEGVGSVSSWKWFHVVIFHGSMVNWRVSAASRSAKFGVVVFTASLLMWGVNLS